MKNGQLNVKSTPKKVKDNIRQTKPTSNRQHELPVIWAFAEG
jgi:hypothetical protein